jgi:hypothetical protein
MQRRRKISVINSKNVPVLLNDFSDPNSHFIIPQSFLWWANAKPDSRTMRFVSKRAVALAASSAHPGGMRNTKKHDR